MKQVLSDGWQLLNSSLSASPALRVALVWQVLLLAGSLLAMSFDHRLILGLNPWIKPTKFELSVIIYLLTVALLLYGLRWHRSAADGNAFPRIRSVLGWGFATAMTVENTVIALQSLRGVRSHMNFSTALDASLFGLMGLFIVVNTVLVAGLLLLWFAAQVRTAPAVTWGVRLGLLVLLAGSAEGGLIVQHGAHTVGAADGLPGLPFLNWSRSHGDLRIAHFFALHALQVLPLAGLLFSRILVTRVVQMAAMFVFTVVYAGGVWWLFSNAMHGRPLL